jgi:hypothetical protein
MRINAKLEFEREERLYKRLFIAAWIVLLFFIAGGVTAKINVQEPLWWMAFCALEFSLVGAQMNARGKAEILGRMVEEERSARS